LPERVPECLLDLPAMQVYIVGMKSMGKKSGQRRQYTIRDVPVEVDRALRKEAKESGKSLNDTAVEALRRATGIDAPQRYHDLDFLIGTWVEDPEFDQALADQRKIDPELWQ